MADTLRVWAILTACVSVATIVYVLLSLAGIDESWAMGVAGVLLGVLITVWRLEDRR